MYYKTDVGQRKTVGVKVEDVTVTTHEWLLLVHSVMRDPRYKHYLAVNVSPKFQPQCCCY